MSFLVNDQAYDYTDITAGILGNSLKFFMQDISYDDKTSAGGVSGANGSDYGSTRGKYACTASFSLLKEGSNQLHAILGPGYTRVRFDIPIVYGSFGSPVTEDKLVGCRITGVADSYSKDGTGSGLVVKYTLFVKQVWRNGICMYDLITIE